MFYANASLVCATIKRLAGSAERLPRAVVVDFGPNSDLDITSAENLLELVHTLRAGGIDLGLAEVRHSVTERTRVTGLRDALGDDHFFHTIDEAVTALAPGE